MYLSLGLLLFKCRIAGNSLANEMRVYKEIPWKSNNQAIFVTLCPLSMPVANAIPSLYCQNILFQFSALCLPNSCHRQLDSVDLANASLPAHYPIPCHALSLPVPSRHKLIGLNPVINRLEKQLSMFAPLLKAGLFGHSSPLSFFTPLLLPIHNSIMPSPPFLFGFLCSGEANSSGHSSCSANW